MTTELHRHWADDVAAGDWDRAVAAIERAVTRGGAIALVCHVDPDGDALGSLLALHLHLRRVGADTVASWGSQPFQIPPQYTFLPGLDTLTPPSAVPDEVEVLIALDTASRDRLGSLAPLVDRAGTVVVVDHHAASAGFGDVRLVAPHAAATAVIVESLLHRLGAVLDAELAACLYVGLVTDTGRFQYPNTDRAAMELGTRLIEAGIRHDEMSRQIFDTHSFGFLKVQARVLDRAQFLPEASLVYSWVEQGDLEACGVAMEETESLIDVLRSVDAAEVSMIAKQTPRGDWKVSLRSKGSIDVGALAHDLGGGGHAFAAGFSAPELDAAVGAVRDRLDGGAHLAEAAS